jgi:hypothetical protein
LESGLNQSADRAPDPDWRSTDIRKINNSQAPKDLLIIEKSVLLYPKYSVLCITLAQALLSSSAAQVLI